MTVGHYPGLLGLRDLGGLRTADGGRVRPGLLFRAGTPQFLEPDAARAFLADTGVRTTVDLRLPSEAAAEGRGPLDALGVPNRAVPFRSDALGSATLGSEAQVPAMTGDDPLLQRYLSYLRQDAATVASIVPTLLDTGTLPALVHCTIGKDRTGAAIALVLDAIGVRRADIAADYAAAPDEVTAGMRRLATMASYGDVVRNSPPEAWTAPPEVMHRFLDRVDADYGGTTALLTAGGVGTADIDRLRATLVEPAA